MGMRMKERRLRVVFRPHVACKPSFSSLPDGQDAERGMALQDGRGRGMGNDPREMPEG
jgi:hypothetical protein